MRRYSVQELAHSLFHSGYNRDGIKAIYLGNTIRQFAATAVGLFVPVYVFQLGASVYGSSAADGFRFLILFLVLKRMSVVIMSLFVEYLIDGVGFRWTLLLSSGLLFIKFFLLTAADRSISYLWVAGVVSGAVAATYWISRHALFSEDQDIERVGTVLGSVVMLRQLSAVAGPVIGGFVGYVFGFSGLFRLGLFLTVLSGLPYFFMHHHRRHHPDGISGLFDKIRDAENFPLMVSWIGRGWDGTLRLNFWPLYVFLVVGSLQNLGILSSLVAIVALASSWLAGWVFDRVGNKHKLFLAGSGVTALVWPVKALASGIWSVFAVDSFDQVSNSFYWIPFLSLTYGFADRRDSVAFFAFREIVYSLGILFFLMLCFLVTFYWSWTIIFLLGAMGVFVSMSLVSYRGFR